MKIAFLLFATTTLLHAQMLEGELLDALGGDWGQDYQTQTSTEPQGEPSDPQIDGNRTSQDLNCNGEEERNTVPYKFLLGLLANKSLDISHDPHSGVLSLNGGVMIGNCQSMLETVVSKPNENIPYYTFQVAVKKPSGCDGQACEYEVTKINDGDNVVVKKSFKPSFAGFVDCLKETGVFKDGKIQQAKVAPIEFTHQERDITQTSEVVYANRGYKGTRYAGKYSSNKLPDYPGCYYFEDMQRNGFKTYSVEDMDDFELERLYQKVCNSGNYKLIDSHISDFEALAPLQQGLIDIRNELILEEVKKLHEIVSEAEDLSEVDKAKFKEVTSDFLENVIKPLKNDLAQLQRLYANPGHSQKEKILKSVFGPAKAEALLGKDPSELKAEIKKEMDSKASDLVNYARSPYLTKEDYVKMASGEAGAPLDDSTWSSAVLDVYEVHNTAFNYGRYSDDFWESHYKDNPAYKGAKRYASGSTLDRKIEDKLREKRRSIKRVSEVAANPDVDYGKNYERTKNAVIGDIDREIAEARRNLQQAMIKVQTQCAREKAQKYWINQQACVRDAQAQVEACQKRILALMEAREEAIAKYDGMIEEWNEARRAAGLEVAASTGSSSSSSSNAGPGGSNTPTDRFSFTPSTPQAPQVNRQYSGQMAQMFQMMQMQRNQSYQRGPGFNINGNLGWNLGVGQGSGYMYGMTPPYSPQYNRGPAGYGQGYGPSGPMSFYGQNYTSPGGAFNFGGGGGLPMGPNYGPAYSPMAPQGGGAGGSFSFGF